MSVSFQSFTHSTHLFKKVDSFRNQTVIVFTLNHNGTKHTNVQTFCDSFVFLKEYFFAQQDYIKK